MYAEVRDWQAFLHTACFVRRLAPNKFADLVKAFQAQHRPVSGQALLEPFIAYTDQDPRVVYYLQYLLRSGLLRINDVLRGLLPKELPIVNGPAEAEMNTHALLFQMLSSEMSQASDFEELGRTLILMVVWLEKYPSSTALAFFAGTVLSNPHCMELLKPHDQGTLSDHTAGKADARRSITRIKGKLGNALAVVINHVNVQNMPLATNLLYWQNELGLNSIESQPEEVDHGIDVASMAFDGSIMDTPVGTRAALFAYLNALLHARPMFEDDALKNLLNARYKGDIGCLMTDLIVSSFDVLANAMYRSETAESMKILRSFLVNKLPMFLSSYVGMLFEPLSAEFCISQALSRLDPTAFPSVSQIGDLLGSSGTLSEAKQEFLFACALHHLLPESSIEVLLGDVPMQSLPAGGRYTRDNLVSQCTSNSSRIEELVAELDNLEGNAGEIALAIVQVRLS